MKQEMNQSLQLLLSTTEQLIVEKGCRNATLQEIMNRTGLSKGAIYHYVKSKDELFALILQAKLEEINQGFFDSVNQEMARERRGVEGPLAAIARGLRHIHQEKDVTNQIFVYLLSQKDNPAIDRLLRQIYEHSLQTSMNWIETGQTGGVISDAVDVRKTAEMFILVSYGFRMRSLIAPDAASFTLDDFHQLMHWMLAQPKE